VQKKKKKRKRRVKSISAKFTRPPFRRIQEPPPRKGGVLGRKVSLQKQAKGGIQRKKTRGVECTPMTERQQQAIRREKNPEKLVVKSPVSRIHQARAVGGKGVTGGSFPGGTGLKKEP